MRISVTIMQDGRFMLASVSSSLASIADGFEMPSAQRDGYKNTRDD